MLDTGTHGRNTLFHTYNGELDGDWSDCHDWAYLEIDSDEEDPNTLRPTKVVFRRSPANSTLKDFNFE